MDFAKRQEGTFYIKNISGVVYVRTMAIMCGILAMLVRKSKGSPKKANMYLHANIGLIKK